MRGTTLSTSPPLPPCDTPSRTLPPSRGRRIPPPSLRQRFTHRPEVRERGVSPHGPHQVVHRAPFKPV